MIKGTRVRIQAVKSCGSARLLHGLAATIKEQHFMTGWVYLELDPNNVTPEKRWSMPVARLVLIEE